MRTPVAAILGALLLACSSADPPQEGSSTGGGTQGPPPLSDLDELLPWAFRIAHEMAADLDVDGDWSRLALQSYVPADPLSGLPRFTFINRATVRVEGGHVKYSALLFDVGESSLTNIVTSNKGLILDLGPDPEGFARSVNEFADFEGVLPSEALAAAAAHLEELGPSATASLRRFEFDYFARPQHLELEFESAVEGTPGPAVRLGPSGDALGD